jgi:hypothetical protein
MSSIFGDDTSSKKDKLSTGITVGYPILRIKGKVWSITRGGNEPHVLMRPDGDGPRNSIDVVLLAASQSISKVWYEKQYVEGSSEAPDCFSPNGVVPDASSKKKQSNACASCPQNSWGSKITPAGKKAKACQDSKRVAVSPLGDIRNEAFGGPMMLRVPAASLGEFAKYGDGLDGQGYRYYAVGTKMSFDPNEAYPKLVFEPIRALEDNEAEAVLELRDSAAVKTLLAEDIGETQEGPVTPVTPVTPQVIAPQPRPAAPPIAVVPTAPPVSAVSDGFGGEAAPPKPVPAAGKPGGQVRAAAPSSQPPVSNPPTPQEEVAVAGSSRSFEDTLDDQLDELLPGAA